MRRPIVLCATVALAVVGALAGAVAATAAPAPPVGRYAAWTAGTPTTMTLAAGFPTATATSTNSTGFGTASAVVQRAGSGAGVAYGVSTGANYLTITPPPTGSTAGTASTTTITFADPTPAGGWSMVFGDIDAETVVVQATGPGGALNAAQLGFQSSYSNSKPPSADVANWDPAASRLAGYPDGHNTDGASAWFSPTVPVTSITLLTTRVTGLPQFQFWIAAHLATIQGTVTTPDGQPAANATVSLVPADPAGAPQPAVPVTTTTDATGSFSVPDVIAVPMIATVVDPGFQDSTTTVTPTTTPAPVDPADPPDPGEPAALAVPVWNVPVALATGAAVVVAPPATPPAAAAPELARTGADVALPVAIGGGVLAVGILLFVVSAVRRRRREDG